MRQPAVHAFTRALLLVVPAASCRPGPVHGAALALDGVAGRVIVRMRGQGTAFVDGAESPAAATLDELAECPGKSFVDTAGRAVWVSVESGAGSLVELR